jgi:hypothetical protein
MLILFYLYPLAILTLVRVAFAAIGPTARLSIVNNVISPDGFARSYVILLYP